MDDDDTDVDIATIILQLIDEFVALVNEVNEVKQFFSSASLEEKCVYLGECDFQAVLSLKEK